MKKAICVLLAAVMLLCAGCGKPKADIPVEKLRWTVGSGPVDGDTYVLVDIENCSDFTIDGLQLTFVQKADITQEEKSHFYAQLQKNQGFSDEFIQDYISTMEKNKRDLTMQANLSAPLAPGETVTQIKCYYMGGWTSRNMIFDSLFTVRSIAVEYKKDGVAYTLTYDYTTEAYTCVETEKQQ